MHVNTFHTPGILRLENSLKLRRYEENKNYGRNNVAGSGAAYCINRKCTSEISEKS